MSRQNANFFLILILVTLSIWVNIPAHPSIDVAGFQRSMDLVLGLDLQGGMQVILQAQDTPGKTLTQDQLNNAKAILENRSNGLGVSEVSMQTVGNNRIVGEFPGLTKTDEVLTTLKETGQLEFVDMGSTPLAEGTEILTDLNSPQASASETTTAAATTSATPTPEELKKKVWHTLMTGDQITTATVTKLTNTNNIVVNFELKDEGAKIFKDFTTNNTGKYLAIVLDKKIISAPVINSPIPEGKGYIEGKIHPGNSQ